VENIELCQAWWCIPITPTHGRLRQEDHEFDASLGYILKPCQKKEKEREGRKEKKKGKREKEREKEKKKRT
jgi:hypothetical protein